MTVKDNPEPKTIMLVAGIGLGVIALMKVLNDKPPAGGGGGNGGGTGGGNDAAPEAGGITFDLVVG